MDTAEIIEQEHLLSSEVKRKLKLCIEEANKLTLRDVRCPYCSFLVTRVFSDARGHYLVKCHKCKTQSVLNLAYFRKQRGIGRRK